MEPKAKEARNVPNPEGPGDRLPDNEEAGPRPVQGDHGERVQVRM